MAPQSVAATEVATGRAIDIRPEAAHTSRVQQYDGKPNGPIDGRSPDPYSPPSWRGTLIMLAMIVVFLGLVAYAFFWAISQPGSPGV